MADRGIFAGCYVTHPNAGALPQGIIDFLLSPGGHSLLVKGEAGTGKTTMALQIIEALSDQQPEYYLSSRVSDIALYHQFPWLKERVQRNQLMRAGMAFLRRSWTKEEAREELGKVEPQVDRRELNRLEGQIEAGELGLEEEEGAALHSDGSITVEIGSVLPELEMAYDIVESNLPRKTLVVLDSVEALAESYGIPAYRIVSALQKDLVERADTNAIFVMETADHSHLDYLGDGIVVLRNPVHGNDRVRTLEIEKLRGSSIRNWRYIFTLEGGRVTVMGRDLALDGIRLIKGDAPLPPERCSFGWSELDRVFGGVPTGSLTLVEIGKGMPLEMMERLEDAMVSEHLRQGRGVLWYPQHTLDYGKLAERLLEAPMETLHVLDPGDGDPRPFVRKVEGEDLASDLRWDSLRYMLKGANAPYVSLLGLDMLEAVYGGNVVPKLLQHVDQMRRGGHIVMMEATEGSAGLAALSHQARLHLRLEDLNGSVMVRGTKPSTSYHCLDISGGVPLLRPML